jgi:hypothetical protein
MNRKVIKSIFLVLLLITAIAALVGYYFFNKGPADVKNSDAIKTEAPLLYVQFSTDSTLAIKKYSDKVIEVTGEVNTISTNQQNEKIILLKTNVGGASINCTMEEDPGNIQLNDLVVIKGICSGIGQGDADMGIPGDVYLTRCYVIKK